MGNGLAWNIALQISLIAILISSYNTNLTKFNLLTVFQNNVSSVYMRQVCPGPWMIIIGVVAVGPEECESIVSRESRSARGRDSGSTPAGAGPSRRARRRLSASIVPRGIERNRLLSRSKRYGGMSRSFGLMRISVPRVWHKCSDSFRTVGTAFPAPAFKTHLYFT